MCLSIVQHTFDPMKNGVVAYKVFRRLWNHELNKHDETKLGFEVMRFRGTCEVPTNRWITAKQKRIGIGRRYISGFHAYVTEKAAKSNAGSNALVLPVFLNEIQYQGRQYGKSVYVARKMFVPFHPELFK